MLATAITCVVTRRRSAAWLLIALSATWMPVNNGVLEGRVLLELDHSHGLTVADLVSVFGFLIAALTLWMPDAPAPRERRLRELGIAGAVVVIGLVTAYFVQA